MALRRAPSNVKSFLVNRKYAKEAMRRENMKTKLNGSTASQSQSHQVSLMKTPMMVASPKRSAHSRKFTFFTAASSNSNLTWGGG